MGVDPENADQPDEPDEQFDPELVREMLLEWANSPPDENDAAWLSRVFDRIGERGGSFTPPTTDNEGNPLPRLDLDSPPAAPEDPLLRVGYTLVTNLPEHWDFVMLQVTGAADDVRTAAMVRVPGGDPMSDMFFADLIEPCSALRRAMYEPGRGAWYNAMIALYRDGTLYPNYDHIGRPFGCWGPREVDLVLRDHELYPRDPEQLPPWHPAR